MFATAFAVLWPVVFGVRPRRGVVAVLLIAALVAQLQLEGFRWQMVPLYVGLVALAFGDLIFLDRTMNWSARLARGLLGTVGLAFALVLPVLLPVPELPAAAGPELIGTTTVELIDPDRDEPYGERPGGPRRFMAQIWFPVDQSEDIDPIPWSADWEVIAAALSRQMGLPSWFWNQTGYTMSHAGDSPRVAEGVFPVVIYSHTWGGFRTNALNQIENLVSNGYIVIAPDHTHIALATVFEDGRVYYQDPEALPAPESVTETVYADAATELVATAAGDLVTILNDLDEGPGGPLGSIVTAADLNRVGIYGHGAGGGAAIKVCLEDERCDAVLAMDPWVRALTERDLQQNMTRPALYMRSVDWVGTPDDALLSGIAARGESVTYSLSIEGAFHNDFLLTPLLSPAAAQLGLKGPIPAGRVIPIVNNYLRGFFDVFLLGTGPAGLDSVTFDEVTVSVVEP